MQLQSNGSAPQPKSLHCNYSSSAFSNLPISIGSRLRNPSLKEISVSVRANPNRSSCQRPRCNSSAIRVATIQLQSNDPTTQPESPYCDYFSSAFSNLPMSIGSRLRNPSLKEINVSVRANPNCSSCRRPRCNSSAIGVTIQLQSNDPTTQPESPYCDYFSSAFSNLPMSIGSRLRNPSLKEINVSVRANPNGNSFL